MSEPTDEPLEVKMLADFVVKLHRQQGSPGFDIPELSAWDFPFTPLFDNSFEMWVSWHAGMFGRQEGA